MQDHVRRMKERIIENQLLSRKATYLLPIYNVLEYSIQHEGPYKGFFAGYTQWIVEMLKEHYSIYTSKAKVEDGLAQLEKIGAIKQHAPASNRKRLCKIEIFPSEQ